MIRLDSRNRLDLGVSNVGHASSSRELTCRLPGLKEGDSNPGKVWEKDEASPEFSNFYCESRKSLSEILSVHLSFLIIMAKIERKEEMRLGQRNAERLSRVEN